MRSELVRAQNREAQNRWRAQNLEAWRAVKRREYQKNRVAYISRAALQKGVSKMAAPAWLTKEHWREIASYYELAQEITERTGVYHVVDHICPLKGETSCGLHVPWNLQVVTHAFNVRKGSKEHF